MNFEANIDSLRAGIQSSNIATPLVGLTYMCKNRYSISYAIIDRLYLAEALIKFSWPEVLSDFAAFLATEVWKKGTGLNQRFERELCLLDDRTTLGVVHHGASLMGWRNPST